MAKDKNRRKLNSRYNTLSERMDELEDIVLGATGLGGTSINEMKPNYDKSEEQMFINHKNTYIVFGRDRLASKLSGKSGEGGTRCDSLDLVVGLGSAHSEDGPPDVDVTLSPNVFSDAARIYLTQRGNIDADFGLAKGGEDFSTDQRSGVVMKADHCRVIGKNSVKIIAGKGKMNKTGKRGEKNSQGGDEEHTNFTIDLIAGNNTDSSIIENLKKFDFMEKKLERKLQPLVKGDNLVDCLKEVYKFLDTMCKHIESNTQSIINTNRYVSTHVHACVPIPIPAGLVIVATPTPLAGTISGENMILRKRKMVIKRTQLNRNFQQLNYLEDTGSKFINSKSVRTT